MAISPFDQESRQRAVPNRRQPRYALLKRSSVAKHPPSATGCAEEKKTVVAVEQPGAEKDAELAALRKENARLTEANGILKLASAFSPRRSGYVP